MANHSEPAGSEAEPQGRTRLAWASARGRRQQSMVSTAQAVGNESPGQIVVPKQ